MKKGEKIKTQMF